MGDATVARNFHVTPLSPFRIVQEAPHDPAFVGRGAPLAVLVGGTRVQHGLPPGAGGDLGFERRQAGLAARGDPVKAVRWPIIDAILEDLDGGQRLAVTIQRRIFLDHALGETPPRLDLRI
jgi:hypothetical protein